MADGPALRAGLKLAAGLAHFRLAPAVRGARAVDVGAATGGFTELLLQQGAAHVTAIDAGQGQLLPRLRADARVASHERTDWRTLSRQQAPGPFDFFTVDVSIVAARSMLPGLALRLRAGAQGVVLLKPQLEVPPRPQEQPADPAVRARALAVFRKKAAGLGFQVVGQMDAPVAGARGTVELLLHLRFSGRPGTPPAWGEVARGEAGSGGGRRVRAARPEPPAGGVAPSGAGPSGAGPSGAASSGAASSGAIRGRAGEGLTGELAWFAVVAPGLEAVARAEVERLPGVKKVEVVTGGVAFAGDLAVGAAANLRLRVATRVLLRVGTVRAREFPKLRRLLGALDFAPLVAADRPLRLNVSATRSRLYHTKALAETVALAIGDRLGAPMALAAPAPPEEEEEEDPPAPAQGSAASGTSSGHGEEVASGSAKSAAGEPVEPAEPVDTVDPAEPAEPVKPAEALETRVLVRGEDDVWTVSVDASGELLHRRGWRVEAGRAPLRETLAAGVLALAGYDPVRPLIDAMCGAGTLALEGAAIAAGRAPGLGRSFALERWPGWPPAVGQQVRARAEKEQAARPPAPIAGWDRDPAVLERARRNAERAGFAVAVGFEQRQIGDWRAPAEGGPGLLVINPPYGRRLTNPAAARALVRQIGGALRAHFAGWRAAVLLGDPRWAPLLGLANLALHPLFNGGLRVQLAVGEVKGARAPAGAAPGRAVDGAGRGGPG